LVLELRGHRGVTLEVEFVELQDEDLAGGKTWFEETLDLSPMRKSCSLPKYMGESCFEELSRLPC
jgi:hypothetical protein